MKTLLVLSILFLGIQAQAQGKCLNTATLAASAFKEAHTTGQILTAPSNGVNVVIMPNLHVRHLSSQPKNRGLLETYAVAEENTHIRPYLTIQIDVTSDGYCELKSIVRVD